MPFKESSIMSQREEMCREALASGASKRAVFRRYGISPTTGHKWLMRYVEHGLAGLDDRSRRPKHSPRCTPAKLEEQVLALRAEHPCWGGRKLAKVLARRGLCGVPSPSTITAILRRHGRLDGPRAGEARDFQRFEYPEPNDLWQMDFKGHFALAQGRCHPLTVLDDHSRYSLEIGACGDERTATVQARLEDVFRRDGLPWRILADNGRPWGNCGGPERHTQLTVWLLDLDIGVIHGRPCHPQTQGKEERFHRTLKLELIDRKSFADLAQAQRGFDGWRDVYNHERPHEAIGMATPASRYRASDRPMPDKILPPDYEPGAHVRKVESTGRFYFMGRTLRFSKAFAGRAIALRPTDDDGIFSLCYRRHVLAQVDLRQNSVQPVHHVSEHPSTLSPV
jgi:transposase InsO family protein